MNSHGLTPENQGFFLLSIIFASLFDIHDNHVTVIRALASVRKGLTRNDVSNKSKIKTGGTLTKTLHELAESGFIEKYIPYKGTKDSLYRLTDEYSLFYIKYIEKSRLSTGGLWTKIHGQQSYKIWAGFSFETICIKDVEQIKESLKISGINSVHGSWIGKDGQNKTQVDLLIDRDDNVINLCEMRFYNTKFKIDKKYANEIAVKTDAFISSTKTKKNVFVTFITSYGLIPNQYSHQIVQSELTLDHLFITL